MQASLHVLSPWLWSQNTTELLITERHYTTFSNECMYVCSWAGEKKKTITHSLYLQNNWKLLWKGKTFMVLYLQCIHFWCTHFWSTHTFSTSILSTPPFCAPTPDVKVRGPWWAELIPHWFWDQTKYKRRLLWEVVLPKISIVAIINCENTQIRTYEEGCTDAERACARNALCCAVLQ